LFWFPAQRSATNNQVGIDDRIVFASLLIIFLMPLLKGHGHASPFSQQAMIGCPIDKSDTISPLNYFNCRNSKILITTCDFVMPIV